MSSMIANFEYDIFISYRHNDNRSGWVTDFVSALQEELAATIKEPLSIYFDENPHDGLLESHDVDDSLKDKLKCLILIPIISRTYCDPKSFAWNNEFLAFLKMATADTLGLKVKLPNGNTASRVLPIRIHELDVNDKKTIEAELQGVLRAIEFTFQSAGVNRPLRPNDEPVKGAGQLSYRDQINKAANAISDIIAGLQGKETGSETTARPADVSSTSAPKKSPKKKWRLHVPAVDRKVVLIFMLLFSLIAVSVIHFSEPAPDERSYRSALLPPPKTRSSGTFSYYPVLSPDGDAVAFVAADSAGKPNLWVRQLNSTKPQALASAENAFLPFWSPDGRYIAFFADGKLKKIDATGGPTQTLCEAPNGRGGTWGKDGTIVFGAVALGPLNRVSSAGGVVTPVTKLDTLRKEVSHRWPAFLPDGQHFLYATRISVSGPNEQDAIFLASLDTTVAPRLMLNASSNMAYANGHLLYGRNGVLMAQPFNEKSLQMKGDAFPLAEHLYFDGLTFLMAFSVSQKGHLAYMESATGGIGFRLTWRDRTGKPLANIYHLSSFYSNVRLSPDGTSVAIAYPDPIKGYDDTWLYEVKRSVWSRFTFTDATDRSPVWSPDGKMIVFSSDRDKKTNLYIKPSDGAQDEQLLFESNQANSATDWSRDGRFIAVQSSNASGLNDIWILPMNATGTGRQGEPFPFLNSGFNESRASFSPDGRWIAYQSNESGRAEIYIRPFPGPGGKFQISTAGGSRPRWRGDGKELFFMSADFRIMATEIKLGASTVEVGTIKSLFESFRINTGGARDVYDVTADGQRFLIETPPGGEVSSPITLVINWPGEMKRK